MEGTVRSTGKLELKVVRCPKASMSWRVKNVIRLEFIRGWIAYHFAPTIAKTFGFAVITSCLRLKLHRANGEWVDYGIVGYRLVTTAFVTALATALHNQASPGNLYYHALGIGIVGAAIGDTGMGTELTTEYTGNVRATGTHTSAAGVYESVATNTIDEAGPFAITEHGVMGANSGASTLIDRHVFAAVNMVNGDSLVSTYQLTLTAGG
jgi:hypothetical protein